MSARARINKELNEINNTSSRDHQNLIYSVAPCVNDLFHWEGYIFGPQGSPYQEGAFKIDIKFTENYPFKAPTITFKTRIFHPNIDPNGTICLDILKDKWSPALTIPRVLMSITSLLTDPNPNDPLQPEAAAIYIDNVHNFNRIAKEWTRRFAVME